MLWCTCIIFPLHGFFITVLCIIWYLFIYPSLSLMKVILFSTVYPTHLFIGSFYSLCNLTFPKWFSVVNQF
jgi:hypothetical protein